LRNILIDDYDSIIIKVIRYVYRNAD
jgi:hypothetical protein